MIKFAGEITDPIHRYIRFTEVERQIIDSPIFQRLRRIRQLSGAYLVYPSALHSRFEHSLGTMHVAGFAGETLFSKGYIEDEDTVQRLRLAALLHDIGHGPFSHLFEEVLAARDGCSHEDIGRRIILETDIKDILSSYGYESKEVCTLSFGQSRIKFLNEIIAGGLSADLMDYLSRDSLFTGVEYGKVDYHRLISSFEVVPNGNLAINRSALNSLESMLLSRYEMFKAVYFHKTVRSGEVMLLNAMILADNEIVLSDTSIDNFLELTDENTIDRIYSCKGCNSIAVKLAKDYRARRLLKCVYEKIIQRQDGMFAGMDRGKLSALRERIADKSGVERNTVFVDASSAPSMPLTPTKKEINSIMVIDKEKSYKMPVSEIPVIDAIAGFLDMLRVYTNIENREQVERAVENILGSNDIDA